jgi:uncharacterized membrane protein YtjA (UPF0391 family)
MSPFLGLAIVFFIVAIACYVAGANTSGMLERIGRIMLFVFLTLAIIFLIIGFMRQ